MNLTDSSARRKVVKWLLSAGGAVLMTLGIFLVLPFMQSIGNPMPKDLMVRDVGIGQLPPLPPAVEQEVEEEEPPPPPPPPALVEEAPPLDLAQLELALNPSFGGDGVGEFTIDLGQQLQSEEREGQINEIFSLADLDQRPRVIFQRAPTYPPDLRRAGRKGTVTVIFLVDTSGKVMNPRVQKSTDSVFDRHALDAVKQWKFEPGTRKGEKVQFKMRIPISFNG